MAAVGIALELQEGVRWSQWRSLVVDVEDMGFAALRVSDHHLSIVTGEARPAIDPWIALGLAAEWTRRVELAVMVSPLTFYVPVTLARMARTVWELADGRMVLGVGAGWYDAEHEVFGIPFPGRSARFQLLESSIERICHALGESKVPILVGGLGSRRTIDIAARLAAEWNGAFTDVGTFDSRRRRLTEACLSARRDPTEVRRSLLTGYLIGRDEDDLARRVRALASVWPELRHHDVSESVAMFRRRHWFVGTPADIVGQMSSFVTAGAELFLLQHWMIDDRDALRLLAEDVMPLVGRMLPGHRGDG